MEDRIAKQKLNVILMVDCSTSMRGERIAQVNRAIEDIRDYLCGLQDENSNVDFYISVITFSTVAYWKNNAKETNVKNFNFQPIKAGGWSNLHLAYKELESALKKQSQGGIMPDFGGIAPIVLLLTDGHPTEKCTEQIRQLKVRPWFNVALRYGIAVELNDERTRNVLSEFVGNNGEVIDCYDSRLLERIMKIIVLTASKVKSRSAPVQSIHAGVGATTAVTTQVKQEIQEALADVDDWEW
ncbi:MAG: VWA domain-containing protein [Christensenellales bacterium]